MKKEKAISLKCLMKLNSYIISYISYILVTYLVNLIIKISYKVSYIYMPIGICNLRNYFERQLLLKYNY